MIQNSPNKIKEEKQEDYLDFKTYYEITVIKAA